MESDSATRLPEEIAGWLESDCPGTVTVLRVIRTAVWVENTQSRDRPGYLRDSLPKVPIGSRLAAGAAIVSWYPKIKQLILFDGSTDGSAILVPNRDGNSSAIHRNRLGEGISCFEMIISKIFEQAPVQLVGALFCLRS